MFASEPARFRIIRITLSLVLCHIIVAFGLLLQLGGLDWSKITVVWQILGMALFITRFIGIPAIICTIIMETLSRRYLQKKKIFQPVFYVIIGALLGGISAFLISRPIFTPHIVSVGLIIILGIVTGLIVSSIKAKLHLIERRKMVSTNVDTD